MQILIWKLFWANSFLLRWVLCILNLHPTKKLTNKLYCRQHRDMKYFQVKGTKLQEKESPREFSIKYFSKKI